MSVSFSTSLTTDADNEKKDAAFSMLTLHRTHEIYGEREPMDSKVHSTSETGPYSIPNSSRDHNYHRADIPSPGGPHDSGISESSDGSSSSQPTRTHSSTDDINDDDDEGVKRGVEALLNLRSALSHVIVARHQDEKSAPIKKRIKRDGFD